MNRFAALLAILIIALFSRSASAQEGNAKFTVGQKVEAWNIAWYKATIVAIGTGPKAGYVLVRYDEFSSNQYLKESSIRVPKTLAPDNYAAGPRSGRYTIRSYGGNSHNPIILGYFDLNGGRYNYYDAGKNHIGSGAYLYEASTNKIIWKSGALQRFEPSADFKISREGKTHSIGLKSRFSTAGSNSIDEK